MALFLCACTTDTSTESQDSKPENNAECVHAYGKWSIIREASCSEEGVQSQVCEKCGYINSQNIPTIAHTEKVIPSVAATCTEAGKTESITCSVCNKVIKKQENINKLGHDFQNGTCSRCNELDSNIPWEIHQSVDKFDRPTGESYISPSPCFGTFTNSATTNAELMAGMLINKKNIAFILWEYGDYIANNPFSFANYYAIYLLDANGVEYTINGVMPENAQAVYISSNDWSTLLDALKIGGTVKVVIEEKDSITKYNFSIDANGFASVYEKWSSDD